MRLVGGRRRTRLERHTRSTKYAACLFAKKFRFESIHWTIDIFGWKIGRSIGGLGQILTWSAPVPLLQRWNDDNPLDLATMAIKFASFSSDNLPLLRPFLQSAPLFIWFATRKSANRKICSAQFTSKSSWLIQLFDCSVGIKENKSDVSRWPPIGQWGPYRDDRYQKSPTKDSSLFCFLLSSAASSGSYYIRLWPLIPPVPLSSPADLICCHVTHCWSIFNLNDIYTAPLTLNGKLW